jgi:hypothetical protein|tara:strand:- start:98 stop:301 length:204 start_codon:yes stop_codon:yes gene_type:complete
MNELILTDNSSKEYIVKDPKLFYNHLIEYHTTNKKADYSVHKENGFYFIATEELFNKVENFVLNNKT